MRKKKTTKWDLTQYLDTPEIIAVYIDAAIEEEDLDALRDLSARISELRGSPKGLLEMVEDAILVIQPRCRNLAD